MSASSFQTGFRSAFAYRSQTALTTAASARWITPFSGPSQRSCESDASRRQNPAKSEVTSARCQPDDEVAKRFDRRDAHLVAPADRERQTVSLESRRRSRRITYAAE